jgi:hypothetical protein
VAFLLIKHADVAFSVDKLVQIGFYLPYFQLVDSCIDPSFSMSVIRDVGTVVT